MKQHLMLILTATLTSTSLAQTAAPLLTNDYYNDWEATIPTCENGPV